MTLGGCIDMGRVWNDIVGGTGKVESSIGQAISDVPGDPAWIVHATEGTTRLPALRTRSTTSHGLYVFRLPPPCYAFSMCFAVLDTDIQRLFSEHNCSPPVHVEFSAQLVDGRTGRVLDKYNSVIELWPDTWGHPTERGRGVMSEMPGVPSRLFYNLDSSFVLSIDEYDIYPFRTHVLAITARIADCSTGEISIAPVFYDSK